MKKFLFACFLVLISGCATARPEKWAKIDSRQEQYLLEHPVFEFEGHKWRIQNEAAYLRDSELREAGQIAGLPLLAERFNVPPYEKLYFKVDRHTFWVAAREKA